MFCRSGSRGQQETETTAMTFRGWCGRGVDFLICIYLIMITAVLPFYFEHGYSYIATDKSLFFRRVSLTMGKALGPVLALYLVFSIVVWLQNNRGLRGREMWHKAFCEDMKNLIMTKCSAADGFAFFYAVALTVSYWCSDYQEFARWGAEGWYMGYYTQMILLCAYFLISKLWKPRRVFFYLMLSASGAVFVLGYLNRFGVYPIKMELSSPGFISTIGNINWYCGYAVTVFFAGAAFLWQGGVNTRWKKLLLAVYVWLGFATLVTQGSASGIMTLMSVVFLMFVMSSKEMKRMRLFWLIVFLMGAACLFTEVLMLAAPGSMNYQDRMMELLVTGGVPIVVTIVSLVIRQWLGRVSGRQKKHFGRKEAENTPVRSKNRLRMKRRKILVRRAVRIVATLVSVMLVAFLAMLILNTMYPGCLGRLSEYDIFTFSDTWGSRRGITWKAGVMSFWEQDLLHKITGVGPDAMEAFIYQDGSPELVGALRKIFGHNYLTNAHNEWLTVLVNTGVLGLTGFGGMMVCAVRSFLKDMKRNPLAGACGFSLIAYTLNNIFSFQQIMNITAAYVIMAMGMAYLGEKSSERVRTADKSAL